MENDIDTNVNENVKLKNNNNFLQSQLDEFNITLKEFHNTAEHQSNKLFTSISDKDKLSSEVKM